MEPRDILQKYYGYDEFRPGQRELIDGVLAGRDVFGIMPTGGGKSMCYQIPALLMPGTTIVISPLISLMRDQVLALKAMDVPAAYINSSLTYPQLRAVYSNLYKGKYKIVYVAPERLEADEFLSLASSLPISFVAVDEAHCISQWGQDFRPSYLRIADFIGSLPRRPVVGAFTATATAQVREDIETYLHLNHPVRAVTGFDRPNLYFQVLRPESKDVELMKLLESRRDKTGIVYCATRKSVETVCERLQEAGFAATRYHAGLPDEERTANQEDFLYDRKTVMVATNAFGMGIDKSNVGFVIHYNMPKSIEHYYQEAGRAGRDGAPADCVLLYSARDVTTAKFLIENSSDNEDRTPEEQELIRTRDYARLESMVGYCKTKTCLRGYLLEYFGQKHPEGCGNCGNCGEDFEPQDITREAQMILSCVRRIYDKLGYWVGASSVVRTLRGSRDRQILELGLDTLSTYGLMKSTARTPLHQMVEHLESEGYLTTELEHQTLRLTGKAREVLFEGRTVEMMVRKPAKEERIPANQIPGVAPEDEELFEALRAKRADLARENGVPAFVIFSNATLIDMARKKPRNMSQFKRVSGVGEIKSAWYGKAFLEVIQKEIKNRK